MRSLLPIAFALAMVTGSALAVPVTSPAAEGTAPADSQAVHKVVLTVAGMT